jgi:threonine dehydratase
MTNQRYVSLEDVTRAAERIRSYVKRTPLSGNSTISKITGTNIYFKQEIFQKTGAFKVRGAFNKMLTLAAEERNVGVVAVSGGNHAQAVAYAARVLGTHAKIFMPKTTPRNYQDATRSYGAEVVLATNVREAFDLTERHAREGWIEVHPFDDPLVMAGQGTIGLEILEDLPQMTDLIVSIGGGGLISGVATAVKAIKPAVRVWGVETEGADAMALAMAAGHPVEIPVMKSIAKTLGAPSVSETTLALARRYLESVTVVSDREAIDALKLILEKAKLLTEPAASCTLSAAFRLAKNFGPDNHVALLLCGGNISLDDLCRYYTDLAST